MNNIVNIPPQGENLKAAYAYADLGWHIFPCWWIENGACACKTNCVSPGKHPITACTPHGQKNATDDKEIIKEWWKKYPKANIALFLEKSGLCAVDIDPRNGGDYTIDELEHVHGKIESDVTALTGGGGEHRIFIKPNGNLPGKLGDGVDLKMNGYIILAPSNHISGFKYEWELSSNPLDGALPSNLPDWMRDLANGSKANYSNAPSIAPLQVLSSDQVRDLMQALDFIDSDDRDTWLKVGMALHATGDSRGYQIWCDWSIKSGKFDSKDQYRVWRSFRYKGLDGIGIATIFAIAKDQGWIHTMSDVSPLLSVQVEDDSPLLNDVILTNQVEDDVPEEIKTFPVENMNRLAEWFNSFSRNPQYQISQAGVLAACATVSGRIYCSTESNTSAMYYMVLGETGIGKNYIKVGVQNMLAETGLLSLLSGSGNTSPGAVFSALFDSPCHIQISDEIGKQLQSARRSGNSQQAEAFTTITEAYSANTSLLVPRNYSKMSLKPHERDAAKQQNIVHWPSITMLGLATPNQVFHNLSTVEIEDGFLNRFVVIQAVQPTEGKKSIKRTPLPDDLKQWIQSIRPNMPVEGSLQGMDTAYTIAPSPIDVEFSDGAYELIDAFAEMLEEKEAQGGFELPDLTRRYQENAMRIATMLAVCESPKSPLITSRLMSWAITFVYYHGTKFMNAVAAKVADSEFHRGYLNVLECITRAKKRGLTERELANNSRMFAATPTQQREQILAALRREELIEQIKIDPPSGRGRAKIIYVLKKYVEEYENGK